MQKDHAPVLNFHFDAIIGGCEFVKNEPTLRQRRSIDDYYIKDASHQEIGGNVKAKKTFTGPGEMEMNEKVSLSSTMSSELSGNFGISGVSMASKLGATWVEGQEYSGKYKVKVPKGKTYRLYLFPNYNLYTFQIYKKGLFKDTYQGSFEFKEPSGVTVAQQDITGWQ
ncbi:hypothetical protein [Paenibacillus popilliae]|uniref:hypothetical protein n=1 Tax=Paenibacillus popilliae TaxID=78057 RepID=UPI0011D2AB0B|nr:hypothetical protein [Paenibacillus popilliae]